MKTKLRIALILLVTVFLFSNFLVSWAPPVQASAANAAELPVEHPAAADEPSAVVPSVIATQPVAQVAVALVYVLFGTLTFIPLLGVDSRSGVLMREPKNSVDQD